MRERFDVGTGLVALGAVLLLVSLFIDWFDPTGDAWATFEMVDIVLAATAVACLAAIVPRYGVIQRAVPAIAFGALFIVAVQLLDAPPSARGDDIESGAWLALGATALMAAGATLSAASISVTVDVRGRDRRRRTAAIDAREAEAEAQAASEDETQPVAAGEPRRSRRRPGAVSASGVPGAAAAAAPDEPPPVEEPRRARRPVDERPAEGRLFARAEERSREGRAAEAERGPAAPHASDPPTAADPHTPDPDRTQAMDPIDRPREDA